jgi:hypothetical protein
MNVDEAFGGKYLKAAHIKGKVVRVTIESIERERVGPDKELLWAMRFLNKEKAFILKPTNAGLVEEFLGTGEFSEWIGREIFLHVERVEFNTKMVDAIRVKIDGAPRQQPPEPAPEQEEFEDEEDGGPEGADNIPL